MDAALVALRRIALTAIIVFSAMVSITSSRLHVTAHMTNAFNTLFKVELVIAPLAALVVIMTLPSHRNRAPGFICAGFYVIAVGLVLQTLFPIWQPTTDTFFTWDLLGGLLTGTGSGIALAGVAALAAWSRTTIAAFGYGGGFIALLLFTFFGLSPVILYPFRAALVLMLLATALVITRDNIALLKAPGLFACVGIVLTVAVLLIRGPGDWINASQTDQLFLFTSPIVAMGCAISLGIVDLSPTARVAAQSKPSM